MSNTNNTPNFAPEPIDDALLVEIERHAVEIARGAGAILQKYFGAALDIEYKDKHENDPVTNADKESQEYLKNAILAKFPDHGVLGEEDEASPEHGRREDESPAPDFVWVLDPLDGTKNFLHGLPMYACSIGVIHKGVPVAAAVYLPWPNNGGSVVMHARKGGGAFADGDPISVFKSDEPKGNALVTLPGGFGGMFRFEKPMRGKVGEVRMTGSIAYELSMVARGVTQYTLTTAPLLWDAAGGVMLVMEAGGLAMIGRRVKRMLGLANDIEWQPLQTFFPSWQSGTTTMKEIRKWRAPLLLASPEIARYITSNMTTRQHHRRRLMREVRKLRPRREKKE